MRRILGHASSILPNGPKDTKAGAIQLRDMRSKLVLPDAL